MACAPPWRSIRCTPFSPCGPDSAAQAMTVVRHAISHHDLGGEENANPRGVDKDGGADVCPVGLGKQMWANGGRPGGYPDSNRPTFGGGTALPTAKTARHASVAGC